VIAGVPAPAGAALRRAMRLSRFSDLQHGIISLLLKLNDGGCARSPDAALGFELGLDDGADGWCRGAGELALRGRVQIVALGLGWS